MRSNRLQPIIRVVRNGQTDQVVGVLLARSYSPLALRLFTSRERMCALLWVMPESGHKPIATATIETRLTRSAPSLGVRTCGDVCDDRDVDRAGFGLNRWSGPTANLG